MREDKQNVEEVDTTEKRNALRLNDYFKVDFRSAAELADLDEQPLRTGYSKNVSVGGICFVADDAVEPGAKIKAIVHIQELEEPLAVLGEVRRCEPLGERAEIAVEFLPYGVDEDQRTKLELFIYDHFLGED